MTTAAKFSPEPWSTAKAPDEDRIRIISAGWPIAEVYGGNRETDVANATVMVAAPVLVNALLRVREYLRGDEVLWEDALDAVNIALAKAGVPDDG